MVKNNSLKINKNAIMLVVAFFTLFGVVFGAYNYIQGDITKQIESYKEMAELSYYRMEDGFELEKTIVAQTEILKEIRSDIKEIKERVK